MEQTLDTNLQFDWLIRGSSKALLKLKRLIGRQIQ